MRTAQYVSNVYSITEYIPVTEYDIADMDSDLQLQVRDCPGRLLDIKGTPDRINRTIKTQKGPITDFFQQFSPVFSSQRSLYFPVFV